MQVHMVVGIDMIQRKSRIAKRFKLCPDLSFELLPYAGTEKIPESCLHEV